jgi:uncharacterized membrane protein YgaE (UPF0421/DUF939 family)
VVTSAARRPGPALSSAIGAARHRIASAGWTILETPIAVGLAWYVAHDLLGEPEPFFAPMAAVLSLSAVKVLRGQRALQVLAGVLLGIGIGTAVKAVAGPTPGGIGAVAIGVATLIALVVSLALSAGFLGEGMLLVNQSAGSAILMIAVAGAATGSQRLVDALIGGGITIVITVVLFPAAPLPLIRTAVCGVLATLRDTVGQLAKLAGADAPADPQSVLGAGQRIHQQLSGLEQAQRTAREIAGLAPRRWPDRRRVRRAGEQAAPLPLVAASVLSLVHACADAGAAEIPPPLPEALRELTSALAILAGAGDAEDAAAHAIRARRLAAATGPADGSTPRLIGGLIEVCADDTLRLTGSQIPPEGPPSGDAGPGEGT